MSAADSGGSAPLGTIGEFSSTCASDAQVDAAGWLRVKVDRFGLRSVGREWMPEHAIADCQRRPARRDLPVEVWYSPGHEGRSSSACFGGLQTCQSPWADPVCSGRISDYRREELGHALAVHRGAGGAVYLLTYTARHQSGTGLYGLLGALLRAVVVMRRGRAFVALRRRYGHVGSVRATEITLGRHGWHPHFHELWFGGGGDIGDLAAEIRGRWMAALEREGLDGLPAVAADVREASMTVDDYVTKYGRPRRWDVDAELTKAISKRGRGVSLTPFDLLRAGLLLGSEHELYPYWRQYYREYVVATKGKSSLHWSPGLRDRLGLGAVSDADIAGGVDELGAVLGLIGHDDWRRIMAVDARLEVLAAAATGEWSAVQAVIDALPVPERFNKMRAAVTRAAAAGTPADYERVREAEYLRMAVL